MFTNHNAMVTRDFRHGLNGDIGTNSFISAELQMSDNVHIANNVSIIGKGKVFIGEGTSIAPGVVIYTSMPDFSTGAMNKYCKGHKPIVQGVHIGRHCFIGANAVIGCGTRVEDRARIKPLAHVKPFSVVKK